MNTPPDLAALEEAIGHRFANPSLAEEALTHPSRAVDPAFTGKHYQRLEFLGDAVVALAVARHLYLDDPSAREGELSTRRAAVCNATHLAEVGRRLGLATHLRLAVDDPAERAVALERALGDAVESLAGAILLDAGFNTAAACVARWFGDIPAAARAAVAAANPKGRLQELFQPVHGTGSVRYELIGAAGPAHRRRFRVRVIAAGKALAEGEGPSHKAAEEAAARAALATLPKAPAD
jgi:ribonuclease-3